MGYNQGFIKLMRSADTHEMIKTGKEYQLLTLIALRAKWTPGFSRLDLEPGEALIGDHDTIGLTQQEYRTAKKNLEKWNLITTRTTNRGTIAKLIDTSIFDINIEFANNPVNNQTTSTEQHDNKQPTTNKERIRKENNVNKLRSIEDVFPKEFEMLKEELNEQSFTSFIKPLRLDKEMEKQIIFNTNSEILQWTLDHYKDRLESVFQKEIRITLDLPSK